MVNLEKFVKIEFSKKAAKEFVKEYFDDQKYCNTLCIVMTAALAVNGYTISLKLGSLKKQLIVINIKPIISRDCSNEMKWFYLATVLQHEIYHVMINSNNIDLEWSKELFYAICDRYKNPFRRFLNMASHDRKISYMLSFEEQYCILHSINESKKLFSSAVKEEELQGLNGYLNALNILLKSTLASYDYYDRYQYIYKNYLSYLLGHKKKLLMLIQKYPMVRLIFNDDGSLKNITEIWKNREKTLDIDFFNYVLIQSFLCLEQNYDDMFEKSPELKKYLEKLCVSYVDCLIEYINNKNSLYRFFDGDIIDYNELLIVDTLSNLSVLAEKYDFDVEVPCAKVL